MEKDKLKKLDAEYSVKIAGCEEHQQTYEVLYRLLMELELFESARTLDALETEFYGG